MSKDHLGVAHLLQSQYKFTAGCFRAWFALLVIGLAVQAKKTFVLDADGQIQELDLAPAVSCSLRIGDTTEPIECATDHMPLIHNHNDLPIYNAERTGCDIEDYLTASNHGERRGIIAATNRGNCAFLSKAIAAQAAGFSALIIFDNQEQPLLPPGLGDTPDVTIPVVMLTQASGRRIRKLASPPYVSINFKGQGSVSDIESEWRALRDQVRKLTEPGNQQCQWQVARLESVSAGSSSWWERRFNEVSLMAFATDLRMSVAESTAHCGDEGSCVHLPFTAGCSQTVVDMQSMGLLLQAMQQTQRTAACDTKANTVVTLVFGGGPSSTTGDSDSGYPTGWAQFLRQYIDDGKRSYCER
jgi:hypothetical protein